MLDNDVSKECAVFVQGRRIFFRTDPNLRTFTAAAVGRDGSVGIINNNNNNNIYLLQLGLNPMAVVILHVYKI